MHLLRSIYYPGVESAAYLVEYRQADFGTAFEE